MRFPALILAALLATPATAQTVAVVGGTVAIGDGSAPIPNGTVVFRDGRIVSAGSNVAAPPDATIIHAEGRWVAAGMVAGFSNLGLVEIMTAREGNDTRAATSPYSASIDVATSVNSSSPTIPLERTGGVTRAVVSPQASSSIFAGQGAVISLAAGGADPITKRHAFQFVELGETGASEAGGSRPAAYALLENAFSLAQQYRQAPRAFASNSKDALVKISDAIALLDIMDGVTPLAVHVERASDIRSVLALKSIYPKMRLILIGACEGWLVADEIASSQTPVIASALSDLPENYERLAATESNVGRLDAAGVLVAISTINQTAPPMQRRMNQFAGNLVALTHVPGQTGLDWGRAFATITSRPAEALGLGADFGSLRPGRRADIVIWDGDPLELSSAPVSVYIDGVSQSMTSRQSLLRDRYRTPQEHGLPKAYEGHPAPQTVQ